MHVESDIDFEYVKELVDALDVRVELFADKLLLVVLLGYTFYDDVVSAVRSIRRYLQGKGYRARAREIAPACYSDAGALRVVVEARRGRGV